MANTRNRFARIAFDTQVLVPVSLGSIQDKKDDILCRTEDPDPVRSGNFSSLDPLVDRRLDPLSLIHWIQHKDLLSLDP